MGLPFALAAILNLVFSRRAVGLPATQFPNITVVCGEDTIKDFLQAHSSHHADYDGYAHRRASTAGFASDLARRPASFSAAASNLVSPSRNRGPRASPFFSAPSGIGLIPGTMVVKHIQG